jgi:hypothetical protein
MRTSLSFVVLLALAACEAPPPPPVPYEVVTDVPGLMAHILEPAADVLWESAGSIVTVEGEEKLAPTTDEGWLAVVHQATVLAEAGNTLMLPIYARDQGDWIEISQGLVRAGKLAVEAARAHDEDALFQAGAQLYSVCVSCHQLYWTQAPE